MAEYPPKLWQGLIKQYGEYLSLDKNADIITLSEGNTPLVKAPAIEQALGIKGISVYLKLEGANPSGSFKDRGMTMAVSDAIHKGYSTMICASTGNTSASAAAYCASARSRGHQADCVVLIPDGKVALGKLAQAIAYGAKILQIEGNFDQALNIVRDLSKEYKIALVNSVNPARIEGQKTAGFEVCDQLGQAPDILSLPVGNAGNISAYWRGFKEYHEMGQVSSTPKMYGFQAAGAAPIVHGHPIEEPETIATAIRIGNPASWQTATDARDQSEGLIDMVTDEEIIEAYRLIHSGQGITCEPASAASVAGLLKVSKQGKIEEGSKIVCILTGHGLKDPQTMLDKNPTEAIKVSAELESVAKAIGL